MRNIKLNRNKKYWTVKYELYLFDLHCKNWFALWKIVSTVKIICNIKVDLYSKHKIIYTVKMNLHCKKVRTVKLNRHCKKNGCQDRVIVLPLNLKGKEIIFSSVLRPIILVLINCNDNDSSFSWSFLQNCTLLEA